MQVSDTINRWLGHEFRQVADVRSASSQPDPSVIYQTHRADLVVATWMGARLYTYFIHTAPKLRDIRNTIKDNSRSGIGTLFIVNAALLPAEGTTVKAEDWQDALSALNTGWIYAYIVNDDNMKLIQVHFGATATRDEYRIWYLHDFTIEAVHVRKRDVQGYLRGTFFVGDIASPDFKRRVNHERANQRFHYRTRYAKEIPHGKNRHHGGAGRPDNDKLKQYYALIGVDHTASEAEIKSAFRQRALQVHPDVSALPRQEANKRIKQLNEAYEYIKQERGWA